MPITVFDEEITSSEFRKKKEATSGNSFMFCIISPFVKALIDIYDIGNWDIDRYKSPKLRYYNLYKYDKSTEDYLYLNITEYQRSLFSQFRYGILPLEIEVGRYRDVPLENRICRLCDNGDIEDEIHFCVDVVDMMSLE